MYDFANSLIDDIEKEYGATLLIYLQADHNTVDRFLVKYILKRPEHLAVVEKYIEMFNRIAYRNVKCKDYSEVMSRVDAFDSLSKFDYLTHKPSKLVPEDFK